MKGKILSVITAILFGASVMVAPVVVSAQMMTEKPGMEQTKPKKVKKAKKKTTKKKSAKKAKKSKKKAAKTPV